MATPIQVVFDCADPPVVAREICLPRRKLPDAEKAS